MPRYELRQGTQGQFWEIWQLDELKIEFLYGNIGSCIHKKFKRYASQEELQQNYSQEIQKHLEKNYVLIAEKPLKQLPESKAFPSNLVLEKAIIEDINNKEKWLVYADWLQTQEDIRGELINLSYQKTIQDKSKQEKLQAYLTELTSYIQYYIWMGKALAQLLYETIFDKDEGEFYLEWQNGFIKKARFSFFYSWQGSSLEEVVKILLESPASKFIETLNLGIPYNIGNDFDDLLAYFDQCSPQYSLRHLYLGDFEYPDESEISWVTIGDIDSIYKAFPNLEYLKVQGGDIILGELKHDKLKHLIIETGNLPEESILSLNDAELPMLEQLEVWFGDSQYGAEGDHSLLPHLLDASNYPQLKHLALKNAEFTDDLVNILVTSKIVQQIKILDLSLGILRDESAQIFIDHHNKFSHLNYINLDGNYISEGMQQKLSELYQDRISIEQQKHAYRNYFYVSVGE